MGMPNIYCPVRASGKSAEVWCLEWTYTDGSGAVSLDSDQSDLDQRIATPVADGGTGLTNIVFPKCNRVRVLHCSIEAPTSGTTEKWSTPADVSASAGTMNVVICTAPTTLADPPSGARGRLVLLLDRT
jgi:hypothetical protein